MPVNFFSIYIYTNQISRLTHFTTSPSKHRINQSIMKIINFVFIIVMIISLIVIINANERKQRSTNLFRDRLLELLLESKRREVLLNEYKNAIRTSDDKQLNNEDHYGRTFVRRKVVGISDNPF